MVAISCTSCLVSLAFVDFDRKRLSFARRQGWVDTWTLDGTDDEAMFNDGEDGVNVCNGLEARIDFLDGQQMGRRVLVQVHDASCLLLRGDQSVRSINNVCPDKLLDRRGSTASSRVGLKRNAPTLMTLESLGVLGC